MYKQIEANKRKTWALLFLFSVFLVGVFMAIGVALEVDPFAAAIIGGTVAAVYSTISFYASGSLTLASQGAKEVKKAQAPEVFTMVENLSIVAGIPMPKLYIIDDESPNAFATGRDPKHASIAVTTGLLKRLEKKELEGVLAHEISHIKNFDIRIMTIVVILIGFLVLLSEILIRSSLRSRSRNKEAQKVMLAALLVGVVLAILSPFIAQIIKLAISRSREYLADASGALLTRYPDGLASALEKIKASNVPLKRANHATAHLYISSPFTEKKAQTSLWQRLFLTHPPIDERIAKLKAM
jgi:heat shock protein HtpX